MTVKTNADDCRFSRCFQNSGSVCISDCLFVWHNEQESPANAKGSARQPWYI